MSEQDADGLNNISPSRTSTARRSRQERERENRSSMEVLSQINKISELESQNDMSPPKPKSSPPKPPRAAPAKDSSAKKKYPLSNAHKTAPNPHDYVYQPDCSQMLGNMVIQAKSDESDTL